MSNKMRAEDAKEWLRKMEEEEERDGRAEHSKYINVGKRVVNRLWLTGRWHWLPILMGLVASPKVSLGYLCRIPSGHLC